MIGPRAASILEQIRGLGEHHSAVEARLRESHETCTEELEEAAAAFEMALRRVGRETDDPGTPPGNSAEPNPGDAAQDAPPALDDAAASRELECMLARIRTTDAEIVAMHQRMDQIEISAREVSDDLFPSGPHSEKHKAQCDHEWRTFRRRELIRMLCDSLLPTVPILLALILVLLLLRPILISSAPGSSSPSSTEQTDGR